MMELVFGKYYFIDEADWCDIKSFFVMSEADGVIKVADIEGGLWEVSKQVMPRLKLHPISYEIDSEIFVHYKIIQDMASTLIRHHGRITIPNLVGLLFQDERINVSEEYLLFLLKSLVANGSFVATFDARLKVKEVYLILGEGLKELEKRRIFAASFASELDALSSRIRLIISHSGTVGTYRENLLQNVLRKHLPERYHVATGFIYGCPRQIDILIYDRLEYAPLFREGELVVVPPNAVRAVIEVKTTLTAEELKESLQLLSAVAMRDDGAPPMFKGVFSFESKLSEMTLIKEIQDYYVADRYAEDCDADIIVRPFAHFTCACVLEKHFAYVHYEKGDQDMMVPRLYTKKSNTDLKSQAAFFMQSLLAHLRYGGLKTNHLQYMDAMLGHDTLSKYHCDLVDGAWGAYFLEAEVGHDAVEGVEALEKQLGKVQAWLEGAPTSWSAE